jgi:hypothetical protein
LVREGAPALKEERRYAHLQVPSTEDTLIENQCLSDKAGFAEFDVRISGDRL